MSDWIHCIIKQKQLTYCGRTRLAFEWCYVDLEHALGSIKNKDRILPCEECLIIAEKENNDLRTFNRKPS